MTFIASGDFLSDDSFANKGLLQAGAFVTASNNKNTNKVIISILNCSN